MADFDAIYTESDEIDTVSNATVEVITPDPVVIRGAGSTTL